MNKKLLLTGRLRWIVPAILVILDIGGYYYYKNFMSDSSSTQTQTLIRKVEKGIQ